MFVTACRSTSLSFFKRQEFPDTSVAPYLKGHMQSQIIRPLALNNFRFY